MPTTVALVRWNGGWTEVVHRSGLLEHGRSEGFLSLGAEQSEDEAERLARAELSGQFGKIREQVTAEHRPDGTNEMPFVAYRPGDKITAPNYYGMNDKYQVQSVTVNEDDEGVLSFVPSIGDTILDVEELNSAAYRDRRHPG